MTARLARSAGDELRALRALVAGRMKPPPPPPIRTHQDVVVAIEARIRNGMWRPAHSPAQLAAETGFPLDAVREAELEARDRIRKGDPLRPYAVDSLEGEARLCACLVQPEAHARRFDLGGAHDGTATLAVAVASGFRDLGGQPPEGDERTGAAILVLRAIAALDAGLELPRHSLISVARVCDRVLRPAAPER